MGHTALCSRQLQTLKIPRIIDLPFLDTPAVISLGLPRGGVGFPCVNDADWGSLDTKKVFEHGDEGLAHGLLLSVRLWKEIQRVEQALNKVGHTLLLTLIKVNK